MPYYTFICGKVFQDLFFNYKTVPPIGSEIIIEGIKWVRAATIPNYAISEISKIDPYSSQDFIERTKNHKGNVGDLMDLSQELSDRRAEKDGNDKIGTQHEKEKAKKLENRRAENKRKKVKNNANN